MFSFIIEKKGKADLSVTGTYMQTVKNACLSVGDVETIEKGAHASNKKNYIVTDTIQSALSYLLKGYKNHITWMQGVVPEESYMRNHSKPRFWVLSMMEKYILKKAKLVLLVSEEMKAHYEKKYKLDLSKKSIIMPCFNETEIVNNAFSADKYCDNTFVYVGSLHKWQCFEQTASVYAKIEKEANTSTKFCVYTFQKEQAESILRQYGVQNYAVDCVDKDELSERIKDIKYGFVLREDCAVNNVATPTKFSNYLANGIIPIYSSALKSFTEFDKTNQLGLIYDLDNAEDGIQNILTHIQSEVSKDTVLSKCQHAFSTYYNADAYTKQIAEKLKEITK